VTTRREPSGATLPTISITLKYWLRNPMSPGMTMTPGMGGTQKSCAPSAASYCSVKPVTLRLGTSVCTFSVSGISVRRSRSEGGSTLARSAVLTETSFAPPMVGRTTLKSISMGLPSSTAKAARKS
jgi:hypothetical protein